MQDKKQPVGILSLRQHPQGIHNENSLAKNLRAITRIAKAAILQDLCPGSMGVNVKKRHLPAGRTRS